MNRFFRRLGSTVDGLVGRLRLNTIAHGSLNGQKVVIKRRNSFGLHITPLANYFFRIVGAQVRFRPDAASWQQAEVESFKKLNPRFMARPMGTDAVCEERLPGDNLWDHVRHGTLTEEMLVAAALELRRSHGRISEEYSGPWSHGDAAMRNFIFDPATGKARLIDFELHHDPEMSAAQRHADDVLSFLLDLLTAVNRRRWLPCALTFLRAYDDPVVVRALRHRLNVPRGLPWIWWMVRTNFATGRKMTRGLKALRRAIDHGALRTTADAPETSRRFHQ
jgi:hypothetical protein